MINGITKIANTFTSNVSHVIRKTTANNNTITTLQNKNPLGESLVKKRVLGLFDLDKALPFKNKTMESFDEITPDKLVLVHLTDYIPENGKISTLFDMTKRPRNTLHFTLNHAVVNPLGAGGPVGWTDKKYAIFAPFNKTFQQSNPIGGKYNDFMFEGSINLPEGSFIYKNNPNIEKGKILFSDASSFLNGSKGITLIEANEPVYDMADLLVKKLGFTNLKELHAANLGSDIKSVNMLNDTKTLIETSEKLKSGELSWDDYFKMMDVNIETFADEANIEKNINAEKHWGEVWADFTKKIACNDTSHATTSYSKIENIFEAIELLNIKNSSWCADGEDYKKSILDLIDYIINSNEKKPDFINIQKLKEIIAQSSTPKEAKGKIKDAFKISDFVDDYNNLSDDVIKSELKNLANSLKLTNEEDYLPWNY